MRLTLSMCKKSLLFTMTLYKYVIINRDCIRFSFMNLLQKELDDVSHLWNTHLICHSRSSMQITGVPNELYYIPQLRGKLFYIVYLFIYHALLGFRDYKCTVDGGDVTYCQPHADRKPQPVPTEFVRLARILMRENNWSMPTSCNEGLILYLNLKNSF